MAGPVDLYKYIYTGPWLGPWTLTIYLYRSMAWPVDLHIYLYRSMAGPVDLYKYIYTGPWLGPWTYINISIPVHGWARGPI